MLELIDGQVVLKKEDASQEILRKPDCFTFHDSVDPSCWRCRVKPLCIVEQDKLKPACFSLLHDEDSPECSLCILESQCTEAQIHKEGKKMPTIVLRKPVSAVKPAAPVAAPVAAEPEVEVVAVEAVAEPAPTPSEPDAYRHGTGGPARLVAKPAATKTVAPKQPAKKVVPVEDIPLEDAQPAQLPDTFGLTDMPIEQLRAIASEFELPTDGRKSILVQRLLANPEVVASLEAAVVEDQAASPSATTLVSQGVTTSPDVLVELSNMLAEGQSLLLTPTNDGLVIIKAIGTTATAEVAEVHGGKAKGDGLKGDAYNREVLTEGYYNFMYVDAGDGKPWEKHTPEEKIKLATEAGVEWEKKGEPKVDLMSMFTAVVAALGVEKYKPEYRSKAARDAIHG